MWVSKFKLITVNYISSAGKESACNAGDPSLIPGSGRSPGEVFRLPSPVFLGFSGGSAGRESAYNAGDLGSILGWEDPLEKRKATHSSILVWRIPWGCQELDRTEPLSFSYYNFSFSLTPATFQVLDIQHVVNGYCTEQHRHRTFW